MIKNKETFYNKQPMIDYGMVTTILINETPVIIEYDDVADDGSPVKVKRQMYRYDSYRFDFGLGTLLPSKIKNLEEYVLRRIKDIIIDKITKYDVSDNVNLFYLQGNPMWLNDIKRTSLIKSTNIRKSQGAITTVLWDDDNNKYDIPVDMALNMLNTLEMYALDCYNMTAQHKKNISEMDSIEDVLNYDYMAGYPKILHLPEDLSNF